jgi:ABC-type multidrug transport system fused ATPase/permease subunit
MNQHSPLRIAWQHMRHYKARLAWALLWRSCFVLAPMQIPLLTGIIVDGLTGKAPTFYGWRLPAASAAILGVAVAGLLVVAFFYGFSTYMSQQASANLSRHFVARLRTAVFEKLTYLSLDIHQRFGVGELLDRAVSDTGALRLFMERVFIQTVANALRVAYPIILLVSMEPTLALIALSVLPGQWLITRRLQQRLHQATRRRRATRSDLVNLVKEHLDGIETIKALQAESTAVTQMNQWAEQLEDDEIATSRLSAAVSGVVWLTTGIGLALTWWLGGQRVLAGEMTIGALVAFTGFVTLAYQPLRQFTNTLKTYRQGSVSLERIQDLLEMPSSIHPAATATPLQVTAGNVEFQQVSFAYSEQPTLTNVTLTLPAHLVTAVVGRSGSGKSSLLRLIARLYDPTQGQVLIDKQPLTGVTLDSLQAQVAVAPQRPLLFSGTVLANLHLAKPDATEAEIEAACREAGALDFIQRLPQGFATLLGKGGAGLSGGELQRLALARALLRRPKVLLLDEPTAALDAETEAALVATLLRLRRTMTIILVSHRLETVRQADWIVVLDEGQVVAQGDHKTLLKRSALYRDLFTGVETHTEEVVYG